MAILDRAFSLVRAGGQGQDRTADLPLFRRSVAFCPPSRKWIISPAHPHFRWRGCQVLRHGHGTTSAAVCRGMPFCPCYSRVDLRPGPGLVLLLCWRENPGQPGTSAPAADSRLLQPDGDSRRNAAHWRTRRRRTTRTLPKHQRTQQARPSFTPAQAGPAATHAAPAAHHSAGGSSHPETRSTTTHGNKKCLLSISKPRGTRLRVASRLGRRHTRTDSDLLVMCGCVGGIGHACNCKT